MPRAPARYARPLLRISRARERPSRDHVTTSRAPAENLADPAAITRAGERSPPHGVGHLVRFPGLGDLPSVEQSVEDDLWHRRVARAVLRPEIVLGDLDVHHADARVVLEEAPDHRRPERAAHVGRVPHETPAGAQVLARELAGPRDHSALRVAGLETRALDVVRARVFVDRGRAHGAVAMARMWPRT
jgi:hypothetical protein